MTDRPPAADAVGAHSTIRIRVTVDGAEQVHEVEPRLLLTPFLQDLAGATGTNIGCDTSSCGACTVHLDGHAVKGCTVLAVQADGRRVDTVASLASGPDDLHPLQVAFDRDQAFQCGYCTPGMLMAAADLLATNPNPSEDEIRRGLEGNICRCTGYLAIVEAVQHAAGQLRASAESTTAPGPADTDGGAR